jgi:uncharacterized membrane protein YbhN (UPF0104 family)
MAGQIGDLIKRKLIVKYLMYCSVVYVLNALQFLVLLKCAGVTGPVVSIYSVCLISLSMMIIAIIPSAPGNIGVLHYGIYSVLLFAAAQYGVHPEASDLLAYARFAVYVHLSYLIPEVIVGGICLIKERKVVFAA